MTFNTKDLRDGHLPLVERIDIALRRVTNGEGQMRVPVEATDPDIVLHNCRDRITELEAELDAKDKRIAEMESNENFKIDLMNGLREDLSQAQRMLIVDRQRNAAPENELSETRALLRDAVAQTLAGNALGVELSKALAEIHGLRAQLSRQANEMIRFTNLANDYATVSQKLAGCESALRLSLAGTEQHYFESPARIDDVRAALAEAQAEIARLTPAAEAYRACVRWENASSYGTQEECASAWTEYLAATRRAIAFIPGATL